MDVVNGIIVPEAFPKFIAMNKHNQERYWLGQSGNTVDEAVKAYLAYWGDSPKFTVQITPTPALAGEDAVAIAALKEITAGCQMHVHCCTSARLLAEAALAAIEGR